MHKADKDTLANLCGGSIPKETMELYALYARGWMAMFSGPMKPELLLTIAVQSGAIRKPVEEPTPFDEIPIGSYVYVFDIRTRSPKYEGTFQGVGDGLHTGMVKVAHYGNMDDILFAPFQAVKARDDGNTPGWADPKQPEDDDDYEPEMKEGEGDTDEALKREHDLEKRREAVFKSHPWRQHARGTLVEVAPPGKPVFAGYFVEIDTSCKVKIRCPELPPGSRDVLCVPDDCEVQLEGLNPIVDAEYMKLLGMPHEEAHKAHPFADVEKGSSLRYSVHGRSDKTGWFMSIEPMSLKVFIRTSKGPKADRDKLVDFRDVILDKDEDGSCIIDLEGMAAAGVAEESVV